MGGDESAIAAAIRGIESGKKKRKEKDGKGTRLGRKHQVEASRRLTMSPWVGALL